MAAVLCHGSWNFIEKDGNRRQSGKGTPKG